LLKLHELPPKEILKEGQHIAKQQSLTDIEYHGLNALCKWSWLLLNPEMHTLASLSSREDQISRESDLHLHSVYGPLE